MNLRNKLLITLFALGTIFMWSCDSLIYDDLSDCPQGVYVKFYSMTPCAVDSTFIGEVPSLTVFAFNENNVLAAMVTEQNVNLSSNYNVLLPVMNGSYTFIGWAGVNDNFTLSSFTPGSTTKKDVMLTLKSQNNVAANLSTTRVWQGESDVVNLPDPAVYGTLYKYTAVNLQEVTNRVKVVVEIDENMADRVKTEDLASAISSANGVMNINGTMPHNSPALNYPILNTTYTDNSVTWEYALMDLVTGYNNNLILTYQEEGEELKYVFRGDLIGRILLNTIESNINLACENDFVVNFKVRDFCADCETYFTCDIFVNGWPVHSYEIEL